MTSTAKTTMATRAPKRIVGIAGSMRTGSFNASLLRAAAALAPPHIEVDVATMDGIPLYNADIDKPGTQPASVVALKERIATSHGLLIVTPEYNHSIPGTLKNTLDWLSRPASDITRVFGGKPVAMTGASAGAGGTRFAQAALLPVFHTLELNPWFGKQLYVAKAGDVFDANGALVDDKVKSLLTDFMTGFGRFVDSV